jgi:hypothetical protein
MADAQRQLLSIERIEAARMWKCLGKGCQFTSDKSAVRWRSYPPSWSRSQPSLQEARRPGMAMQLSGQVDTEHPLGWHPP